MLKQGRIVALDTTRNLLAGVSGTHLRLRVSPDRLPEVLRPMLVRQDGVEWVLAIHRHAQITEVLLALRDHGIEVVELQLQQPDLEEAFVSIVGRG